MSMKYLTYATPKSVVLREKRERLDPKPTHAKRTARQRDACHVLHGPHLYAVGEAWGRFRTVYWESTCRGCGKKKHWSTRLRPDVADYYMQQDRRTYLEIISATQTKT